VRFQVLAKEIVLAGQLLLGLRMTFPFRSPIIVGMTGVNLGLPKAWVVNRQKKGLGRGKNQAGQGHQVDASG